MAKIMTVCLFIVSVFCLNACAPFVDVVKVDQLTKEERTAAFKVRIYENREAYPEVSEFLESITAYSCKLLMTDPPATTSNAMEQLRIKACRMQADAVVNVRCNERGTDTWGTNCWETVICAGDAVRFKLKTVTQ